MARTSQSEGAPRGVFQSFVREPTKLKDADFGDFQKHDPHGLGSQSDSDVESVGRQIELEAGNSIKYRTCSWQKTAALLFSEYICLAIMSFPWAYSVLGLVPGLILTVFVAATVLYTSLIVWQFCLRHPEIRDVCDIGQYLFWNSKIAWYLTAVMFILNNTFIQGLHCLVGAEYLNTMTGHSRCTIVFSAVWVVICFVCSLPRTFNNLSKAGTASALFTFISVLLATIFSGIEDRPAGYTEKLGKPLVTAFPIAGTTFVNGLSAFLNISFTFIGQITLPSFIAEMKEPRDFWKAVTVVTIAELLVFSLVGAIIYAYTGNQYITSPAFGSLSNILYKKVAFSFMVPTLIFLGVLYASVSARFIFFRIFENSRHKGNHTVLGWASWTGILAILWLIAFIIAEVVPFFSDLESIISSLFNTFFGYIFWALAYIQMRRQDYGPGFWKTRGIRGWIGICVNLFFIGVGLVLLGPGTYVSVMSVIQGYRDGTVGKPFSCASNGL